MKILIYSDVHGNLPAFEKMLDTEDTCEAFVCLGDLVNYGPWSNECVDLALSLPNADFIMGNHEEAFIAGSYPGSNPLVTDFFRKTYEDFARKENIQTFKPFINLDEYICTHTINNDYIYPDTNIEIGANYIIGHSHHQFRKDYKDFRLYNAGSVGQNRRYINVINYLVYDRTAGTIELKGIDYNLNLLLDEMKIRNYPRHCIDYYLNKPQRG